METYFFAVLSRHLLANQLSLSIIALEAHLGSHYSHVDAVGLIGDRCVVSKSANSGVDTGEYQVLRVVLDLKAGALVDRVSAQDFLKGLDVLEGLGTRIFTTVLSSGLRMLALCTY